MAARKRTTSTSTSGTDSAQANPRLEMAKALNAYCAKQEALEKAYEAIRAVTKDTLTEFDLEIEAKKQEIERLGEDDLHLRKRLKTETDLYIAEYRYEAATKILEDRGEVPIPTAVLKEMKERLASLSTKREEELQQAVDAEKAKGIAALKSAVDNCNLQQKAQTAVLEATNAQQTREIESLRRTISEQKNEIAEQRKLTAQIADSLRAAPISQQFGK